MTKSLRFGSKGTDVIRVQQALNRRMLFPNNQITRPRMARLVEDGDFGNNTRAMVVEFQRLNRLAPDGVVGRSPRSAVPFVSFDGQLKGNGLIRGRPIDFLAANRSFGAAPLRVGGSKAKEPTVGEDEEPEGLAFKDSFSAGLKHEFKPWFVLRPKDEPEGAESSATIGLEAVLLRKAGFEFSSGFEFSRKLVLTRGTSWVWEGSVKGEYKDVPTVGGGILTPLSPAASLKLAQGGAVAAGVGQKRQSACWTTALS